MNLGFSTLICPEYKVEELKRLCNTFGMCSAELRIANDIPDENFNSVNISDIASSFRIIGYNKEQLDKIVCFLKRMEELNISAIRIFLGNFMRKFDDPVQEIDYDGIVRMLSEMCDSSKCEIWVETHNEFATGKVLKKLMEDVSRDNLKIIWDVMHPFEDGETPDETYNYIKEYIAHVHIKDGRKKQDPSWHDFEYTKLGEGEVPIKEIVTLLENGGYNGCYSLEWENMWRDELKSLGWSVEEILRHFVSYMNLISRINELK